MRRIKFIKELGKRQGQGAGPEYKAGEFHEFIGHVAESYAQAYIDRGFAVAAPDDQIKKADHYEKMKPSPAQEANLPVLPPVTMTSIINKPVLHKAAQEYGKRK